jgi:hypothetical protein
MRLKILSCFAAFCVCILLQAGANAEKFRRFPFKLVELSCQNRKIVDVAEAYCYGYLSGIYDAMKTNERLLCDSPDDNDEFIKMIIRNVEPPCADVFYSFEGI